METRLSKNIPFPLISVNKNCEMLNWASDKFESFGVNCLRQKYGWIASEKRQVSLGSLSSHSWSILTKAFENA